MAQEIADSKLIDTWSSDGLKVKPDISKIIEGWQLGEQPPHEYMNWLQNTFGSKLNHLLKNGVAKWNNETPYLAGSSVQHNGNVWLCKVDNANSEPTDVTANWKRFITVEALDGGLLNGYVDTTTNQIIDGVKTFSSPIVGSINGNSATVTNGVYTTGNQTIGGVKTFSSSPIVPTPTTANQAVNKAYVDSKAGGGGIYATDFTGINQSLSDKGYQKLPGGLIIQWGRSVLNDSTDMTVNLPITYPTKQIACYISQTTSGLDGVVMANATDNSTITLKFNFAVGSITVFWLSIGY